VVTTGFANLSDGAKVVVGKDENTPTPDLAPRKRRSSRDLQNKDGQAKRDWQGKDGEHRGKRRERGEGDQKGQTAPAQGGDQSGGAAKPQP
jgi:membrane fusion protein, multidrug efflux system